MTGFAELPEELLVRILNLASVPLPYPWNATLMGVCAAWRRACLGRQGRGWYLEHSSLR